MEAFEVCLRGERFLALSSKALFWPEQGIVFVADVHLGKAASFRALSLPAPHGTTSAALARLSKVLQSTGAKQLVVLGDLWHHRLGRSDSLVDKLGSWTAQHPDVEFTLITGNHDERTGKTPPETGFMEAQEVVREGFCFLHEPATRESLYVLCGHLHPGATLSIARTGITAPCFWFGPDIGTLPAFGEFTGLARINPGPSDCVIAVAEEALIPIRADCL